MKLLTEILNEIDAVQVLGNPQGMRVSGIASNSLMVKNGSIFIAIKGYKSDGHNYIHQAISNGAKIVVVEETADLQGFDPSKFGIILVIVKDGRTALSQFSISLYGNPSSKLFLTGITGTKGKTTTAFLLKYIFDSNNLKSGLIGTIANYVGDKKIATKLTTPEANVINELMFQMIEENCKSSVMEASSHSLYLKRAMGLNFDCAVFSNLTSDHMDFHETYEDYLKAKKILFDGLSSESYAIVNFDDEAWEKLISSSKANVITYGMNKGADFRISDIEFDLSGSHFNLSFENKTVRISTNFIGNFNCYNVTSAFIVAKIKGIEVERIIESIKNAPQVPGRFEVISNGNKNVIIDYAHTADSLKQTLMAINQLTTDNHQIVTVVGCGGDRDKTKRPIMGKIASDYSDLAVLTSDNPRTEDPDLILKDVVAGVDKDNHIDIVNREEAIKYAINESKDDAVVLIAGKGHENYQEVNGVRHHFSDKEIAEKYLEL